MTRVWVTAGILSLLANLSLAANVPNAVTHSDFPPTDMELALLGRDLFYDPLLSGNLNISCATCHHPSMASGDAMSLSLGEGATGMGADRTASERNAPAARIPRNAPALFNLGAFEYVTMFHDGRVERDPDAPFGIRMPKGRALDRPVASVLVAQALMPIQSGDEMAGQPGENAIADALATGNATGTNGAYALITERVADVPDYAGRFATLIGDRALHITDIARAIAEFEAYEFRATSSPFDAYISGDARALAPDQKRGMALFYGQARCSTCHSGPFQTDHRFHSIALPQVGPGKTPQTQADTGRGQVTGMPVDAFRFRTPSLRNVAQTAPYGHNGVYADLRAIIHHHLDPIAGLAGYDRTQVRLHDVQFDEADWRVMDDFEQVIEIATSAEIPPVALSEAEIADLIAFLGALSDPLSLKGRLGVPDRVPSGLPVDR